VERPGRQLSSGLQELDFGYLKLMLQNNRSTAAYFPRELERPLLAAAEQFPVILLTGPRQVGKTTLLEHLRERERRYVTLDDLGARSLALEDPSLFLQQFPPPVLIDEIQYAPGLLPAVKMAVDNTPTPGSFWLTGSQPLHLMRGISESLAGRVAVINLFGFSNRERHRAEFAPTPFIPTEECLEQRRRTATPTSLPEVFRDLWLGSLPALASGMIQDRDLFFSSYLQTYLLRDVRDLSQIGDTVAFVNFIRACAARTAQLLNLSDLARDADISVPTAKKWLSVLEASYQVVLLHPFHTSLSKRLVKRPKLYFLDTGLCAYLAEWTSPETLAAGAMRGAIFETWVFNELLKSWRHRLREPRLYFYRDQDGVEIDFILEQEETLYPMEVKVGATPHRSWTRPFNALRKFGKRYNQGPGAVICLCPEPLLLDEQDSAVPVGLL